MTYKKYQVGGNWCPGRHDPRLVLDDDIRAFFDDRSMTVHPGGYARVTIFPGERLPLHHVVAGCPLPGYVIDHINGNPLDNRRCNLRAATKSQNAMNRTKLPSTNTSGYLGVSWSKKDRLWTAYIMLNKKHHKYLGGYKTPELASRARKEAELKYYGAFAPSL